MRLIAGPVSVPHRAWRLVMLVGAAMLSIYASVCNAEIEASPSCRAGSDPCQLKITGTITAKDALTAATIVSQKNPLLVVTLDSPGGDVDAAIAIGRILRRNHAAAVIGSGKRPDTCASACVLVLAGAPQRAVWGRVGIHRLYTVSTASTDYESLQRTHREFELRVKAYLREMNIPESLYDAMTRYPSDQIHFLTAAELGMYHLDSDDPVLEDLHNSRAAAKYGISKPEYLRRLGSAKQLCNNGYAIEERLNCEDDILSGRRDSGAPRTFSFEEGHQTTNPSSYDSEGWTQESTGSTKTGPWLKYSPPGTRYCRYADRTIIRLYPPGMKPDAERANPFCLGASTEYVPR